MTAVLESIGSAEFYEPYDELDDFDPDAAYELFLENGGQYGWLRQAEEEDYERSMGVVSFEDAWDAADPAHAAERPLRHAESQAYEEALYLNRRNAERLDESNPAWEHWNRWMERRVDHILAEQGLSRAAIEARAMELSR